MGAGYKVYPPRSLCTLPQDLLCSPTLPFPQHKWPARSIMGLQGWCRGKSLVFLWYTKQQVDMVYVGDLCMGWCLPKCGGENPSHHQGCLLPLLQFGPTAIALLLHGDCSTSTIRYSATLSNNLFMGTHMCLTKGCRLPTLLRRRQLRCWPGALPWLISTTDGHYSLHCSLQLCSLQCSSVQRDQLRGQQSPPGWLFEEKVALCIHTGRQESSHLHTPCSSRGSPRLRELAWNNNTTHFSLTFPKWGNRKSSQAIGRTREGYHIFICHKLCLGEQQAQQAIAHQSRVLLRVRALHYSSTEALTGHWKEKGLCCSSPSTPLQFHHSSHIASWKGKYFF